MLEDKLKEFSVSFLLLISVQEVYTKKRRTEHEKLQRHIWREIIVDTKILVSLLKAKTIRWCPPLLKWYYLKITALHEIMKNRNIHRKRYVRKGVLRNFVKFSGKRIHRKRYVRKGVLRNFVKFSGKRMCQSLFFDKLQAWGLVTLLKKRFWQRCFPVNFAKFLRTPFPAEHLRWLVMEKSGRLLKWSLEELSHAIREGDSGSMKKTVW